MITVHTKIEANALERVAVFSISLVGLSFLSRSCKNQYLFFSGTRLLFDHFMNVSDLIFELLVGQNGDSLLSRKDRLVKVVLGIFNLIEVTARLDIPFCNRDQIDYFFLE